jgi:transcriptional regulator with XRE-family HTH domain
MRDAGTLIRERRRAHCLTQAQLALRAGTTQAAVSRLECGELSPTLVTLERLLDALGEELEISASRPELDADLAHLRDQRRRTPAERLELAIGWNRLAGELTKAGREARE